LTEIEDVDGTLLRWIEDRGRGRGSVTIVRPDRFVAGQVRAADLSRATAALSDQLS